MDWSLIAICGVLILGFPLVIGAISMVLAFTISLIMGFCQKSSELDDPFKE